MCGDRVEEVNQGKINELIPLKTIIIIIIVAVVVVTADTVTTTTATTNT